MARPLEKIVINDTSYETVITRKFKNRVNYIPRDPKKINAFIPGLIREVYIKKGQKVKEGDKMFILEAMKMRNLVFAPFDGKILDVYISTDQRVAKNEILIEFE